MEVDVSTLQKWFRERNSLMLDKLQAYQREAKSPVGKVKLTRFYQHDPFSAYFYVWSGDLWHILLGMADCNINRTMGKLYFFTPLGMEVFGSYLERQSMSYTMNKIEVEVDMDHPWVCYSDPFQVVVDKSILLKE